MAVNIIKNGETISKKQMELPETLTNVIFCKNPRCITTIEQEITQEFILTDRAKREYRCMYCDTKAEVAI